MLIAFAPLLRAQKPEPRSVPLQVVVLDGNRAVNDLERHTANQVVVEVRDENQAPLRGVTVLFQLPAFGAGAYFAGGTLVQTAVTNRQGQASTVGMTPNTRPGRFVVQVKATIGMRSGVAVVEQENVAKLDTRKTSHKKWVVLAAVGAAGAVGAILGGRSGGSTSSTSTVPPSSIVITPGAISVGGPR
jgi:hypothetical protein